MLNPIKKASALVIVFACLKKTVHLPKFSKCYSITLEINHS